MISRAMVVAAVAVLVAGCAWHHAKQPVPPAGGEQTATQPDVSEQQPLPVVQIDDRHLITMQSDGTEAPAYVIDAREGFVLDAKGYRFTATPDPTLSTPTVIQLILDQRGLYEAPWKAGVEQYTLTAATLLPKSGSAPFGGFKQGDRVILSIGHERAGKTPDQTDFFLLWAGAINVR